MADHACGFIQLYMYRTVATRTICTGQYCTVIVTLKVLYGLRSTDCNTEGILYGNCNTEGTVRPVAAPGLQQLLQLRTLYEISQICTGHLLLCRFVSVLVSVKRVNDAGTLWAVAWPLVPARDAGS